MSEIGAPACQAAMLAAILCAGIAAGAPAAIPLALTFDDLPAHGPLPPGGTRLAIAEAVVATLRADRAPATGFVNGSFGADDPQSPGVLAAWRGGGLALGNHGFSHLNADRVPSAAFVADIDRNEPLLAGEPRRFRYPYLAEGDDAARRDAIRAALAARHYRIAAVTLSFEDYAYNAPYARCLAQGDRVAVAALERAFLAAAQADARRGRGIARAALGRDVPQIVLLHIGAFTAHMLPRLLQTYRRLGFRFATLDEVQRDPFYAATDPALPGPSPTLEPLAPGAGSAIPARITPPDDRLCPAR